MNDKIPTTTLKSFPYHKASYCPNCNKWYPKAKKIYQCPICGHSLRIWPKKGKSKERFKKMLKENEKQRPRTNRYKKNNRDKISKYNKKYYEKNKELIKQKKRMSNQLKASRKWKEKNKERVRLYRKKYYEQVEKPKRSKTIVK